MEEILLYMGLLLLIIFGVPFYAFIISKAVTAGIITARLSFRHKLNLKQKDTKDGTQK